MKSAKTLFCSLGLVLALGLDAAAAPAIQDQPSGTPIEQGLWYLYHLQYDESRRLFNQYIDINPQDPAGYFYRTAADWWQLAQQFDRSLPEIQARLDSDYQETVRVAGRLIESSAQTDGKTRGLACLYSGGAQGLMGRWLVTQRQWMKAYFLGKSGHKMLKRALKYDPTLYDAYLGLGIYDYFTDTLGGVQKVLAAVLIRGDRKRGLRELQIAIDKSKNARVEAMTFLIEIYTWEEDTPEKALPLAQALHKEFPKSPAMHLAEILDHYELKNWNEVWNQSLDYLQKSETETPYYKKEGVLPAWYCLGVSSFFGKHDLDSAAGYMDKIVANSDDYSRWRTFAFLRLGQIADAKKNRDKALDYYKKVLNRPNFWGSHAEAERYTKEAFHT